MPLILYRLRFKTLSLVGFVNKTLNKWDNLVGRLKGSYLYSTIKKQLNNGTI